MHRRTRATGISKAAREEVIKRDGGLCIFCGRPGNPEAHVISRAQGGLGDPQNIVTACRPCHEAMDAGLYRPFFIRRAKEYLESVYGSAYEEHEKVYRKGGIS